MEFGAKSRHPNYQVFLGGSCNPTTWRRDHAIPFLQKKGVIFYNPQVDTWSEDLIELEDKAKKYSKVLLWVINNQTRGTSSLVEVAHILGSNRDAKRLALSMSPLGSRLIIDNERLIPQEIDFIKCARNAIFGFAHNRGIPVLNSLPKILQLTDELLKDKIEGSYGMKNSSFLPYVTYKVPTKVNPVKFQIYKNYVEMKFEENIKRTVTLLADLKGLNSSFADIHKHTRCLNEVYEMNTFEEFFCLVNKVWQYDREKNPWGAEVIFFDIHEKNRCLCSLVWAAFFLATVPEAMVIHMPQLLEEDMFSKSAMIDYRRARIYLGNLAKQNNVPVFEKYQEAVDYAWKSISTSNVSAKIHYLNGHD